MVYIGFIFLLLLAVLSGSHSVRQHAREPWPVSLLCASASLLAGTSAIVVLCAGLNPDARDIHFVSEVLSMSLQLTGRTEGEASFSSLVLLAGVAPLILGRFIAHGLLRYMRAEIANMAA